MSALNYEGHRVDETSQVLLQVLRDRREAMTTGELRKQADLEQNRPVQYRMDEYLVPAGLVERAGERKMPGGSPNAKLWRITDEGREWVSDHAEDLTIARDAHRAIESLQRTRETVDRLSDDLEAFNQKVDGWQETMNRRSKRIHQLEEQQKSWRAELVEQGDEAWNKARDVERTVSRVADDVDELETRMESLEDDVDQVTGYVEDVSEWLESFDDRVGAVEGAADQQQSEIDELRDDLKNTREELSEVRKTANRGFLDRLLQLI
jgi:uncharacterized coiled-coil DUF342 family protein